MHNPLCAKCEDAGWMFVSPGKPPKICDCAAGRDAARRLTDTPSFWIIVGMLMSVCAVGVGFCVYHLVLAAPL